MEIFSTYVFTKETSILQFTGLRKIPSDWALASVAYTKICIWFGWRDLIMLTISKDKFIIGILASWIHNLNTQTTDGIFLIENQITVLFVKTQLIHCHLIQTQDTFSRLTRQLIFSHLCGCYKNEAMNGIKPNISHISLLADINDMHLKDAYHVHCR